MCQHGSEPRSPELSGGSRIEWVLNNTDNPCWNVLLPVINYASMLNFIEFISTWSFFFHDKEYHPSHQVTYIRNMHWFSIALYHISWHIWININKGELIYNSLYYFHFGLAPFTLHLFSFTYLHFDVVIKQAFI